MNIKPLKSRLLLHSRETLVEEKSRDFQENVLACLGFGEAMLMCQQLDLMIF